MSECGVGTGLGTMTAETGGVGEIFFFKSAGVGRGWG